MAQTCQSGVWFSPPDPADPPGAGYRPGRRSPARRRLPARSSGARLSVVPSSGRRSPVRRRLPVRPSVPRQIVGRPAELVVRGCLHISPESRQTPTGGGTRKTEILRDQEKSVGGAAYVVRALLGIRGDPPASTGHLPPGIALVLDRSGSMSGAPLERAKEAAALRVRRLAPEDVASVVAYDREAHSFAEPVTGAAQADLVQRIGAITSPTPSPTSRSRTRRSSPGSARRRGNRGSGRRRGVGRGRRPYSFLGSTVRTRRMKSRSSSM